MPCRFYGILVGIIASFAAPAVAQPSAPTLNNSPVWDVIVTNRRPLLSFANATGGKAPRTYEIQLDTSAQFDSPAKVVYKDVPEDQQYLPTHDDRVTSHIVAKADALKDGVRYHWRVRAIDADGKAGPWAVSRFSVDTKSNQRFMNLRRLAIHNVTVSGGVNAKNIVDYDDPGQTTFWQSTPPGDDRQWVMFDLGTRQPVSRIWMLANPSLATRDNWLKDFRWMASDDQRTWRPVEGAAVADNDSYRNILDFKPVRARYFKLEITGWYGYAPQLNCVILYTPGAPAVPAAPKRPYVLCVGNQMSGRTFTQLARHVRNVGLGLETLTVPHHEVSLEMVRKLDPQPTAIILSGNNADYNQVPMFEYNGEFELIRESPIPILGICCGHQMTVMAYGFTYVRSMGWSDITSLRPIFRRTEVQILKPIPLFAGLPNPFSAPEIHGCAVAYLPENYVLTAKSTYAQCLMRTDKPLYGEQFHAEINSPTNQAGPYLKNFLIEAMKRSEKTAKK